MDMNRIKAALTRKLGPLPVWAWALIGGVALYMYRARHSTVSSVQDNTAIPEAQHFDPVTLQRGEAAFDPNTGTLYNTPAPIQDPQSPITLEPGERVYDPNSGKVLGDPATAPPGKKKKKHRKSDRGRTKAVHDQHYVKPRKRGKGKTRDHHHKPQHTRAAGKRVEQPGARNRSRIRTGAPVRPPAQREPITVARRDEAIRSPHASMPHTAAAPPRPENNRTERAISPRTGPVMRQRPAAPHVVDQRAQRTVKHPARPPAKRR